MINETHILSSILDNPVKQGPSFQTSHLDQSISEQFDHVLQDRSGSYKDQALPAGPPSFEAKENFPVEHAEHRAPVSGKEQTPPSHVESRHADSRPTTPDREPPTALHEDETTSEEPASKTLVNPFALPFERLARELNATETAPGLADHANPSAVDALAGLFDAHGLNEEGSAAIDTLKDLLAGLNIDSETIDQLIEALSSGDAAGIQGILNALRGLLQASSQVTQAPVAELVSGVAENRLSQPEQLALNLLVRAGLTQEEAQAVIQQARAGNSAQPATEISTQLAKSVIDGLASKLNSESSSGSGNLQNGDSNGSPRQSAEGPRNFSGLAADRLESLASLLAPDKAGNVQTNPLIAKSSPLLTSNTPGQPVQGVLAEGTPAAVADAAAKGVDFVKPAVTETYNGRASMDKPITAQIIEKFTLRGFGNQREVHIKLDPPSLGTVRMNVSTSGESVRATIVAENNIVKSVIENNLSQLKDSITQQGIKIDSFNVLVGGNASHSTEGHKTALDYLGQLGRGGSTTQEQMEETVILHRPIFLNENQSFSIFA